MTLEYQHTFSPGTLNTARFGFNRSVQEADNVRTVDIPANLSFVPGDPPGYISISGVVTELGGDFRLPRLDRLNNFQWGNTLFLTRGAHALRLGAQGQRLQFNQNTVSQRGGVLNFDSLESCFCRDGRAALTWLCPGWLIRCAAIANRSSASSFRTTTNSAAI